MVGSVNWLLKYLSNFFLESKRKKRINLLKFKLKSVGTQKIDNFK